MRITSDTRKRLDQAARHNERSLSEEVEKRLLSSFDAEDRTVDAFLKLAGLALAEVDDFTGQSWIKHPYTFELAAAVWSKLILRLRPSGDVKVPDTILPVRALNRSPAGAIAATDMLARLSKEKPGVFADGIVRVMIGRLRYARPEFRDIVDQIEPKIGQP